MNPASGGAVRVAGRIRGAPEGTPASGGRTAVMPAPLPPYEKMALGFGAALAAIAYGYWTYLGYARGEGWTAVGASRALVVLGASALLALVLRLAVWVNSERP